MPCVLHVPKHSMIKIYINCLSFYLSDLRQSNFHLYFFSFVKSIGVCIYNKILKQPKKAFTIGTY